MKKILIGLIITAISYTASARNLNKSELNAVEEIVKKELLHPETAKFWHQNLFEVEDGDSTVYCGYFDEKDMDGKYTGKQLFSVLMIRMGNKYDACQIDRNDVTDEVFEQSIIAASCAEVGYDIKVNRYLFDDVNKKRIEKGFPPLPRSFIEK